jgi:hypothetical protein
MRDESESYQWPEWAHAAVVLLLGSACACTALVVLTSSRTTDTLMFRYWNAWVQQVAWFPLEDLPSIAVGAL